MSGSPMSARSALLCLLLFMVPACATKPPPGDDARIVIGNAAQVLDSWDNQAKARHSSGDAAAMRSVLDLLRKTLVASQDKSRKDPVP